MTFFTLFFTKVACNILRDRFSEEQTEAIIREMWRCYDELPLDSPNGLSRTGDFLWKSSGAGMALFQILLSHGVKEHEARQVIADVNWKICELLRSKNKWSREFR